MLEYAGKTVGSISRSLSHRRLECRTPVGVAATAILSAHGFTKYVDVSCGHGQLRPFPPEPPDRGSVPIDELKLVVVAGADPCSVVGSSQHGPTAPNARSIAQWSTILYLRNPVLARDVPA